MTSAPRSSESDLDAFEAVCDRLAGFDDNISAEWVDGFLTALLAGPRAVVPSEWLPHVCGESFGRAFADPADVQQAMNALMSRWNTIASQLDPEPLLEDPEALRLTPLMLDYDNADLRAELKGEGRLSDEELKNLPRTGEIWALGFVDALDAFPLDWPEPDLGNEEGQWYDACLARVAALTFDEAELGAHFDEQYEGKPLPREELVDEACFAVQDLRIYWLDHAPKPAPVRVDALPGRNDPCPCGSGKKFKKCHGAAVH